MREIVFRGMDVEGEWHFGNLNVLDSRYRGAKAGSYISNYSGAPFAYQVRPETVGQFTGLRDKNGTMIFEGDIIRWKDWVNAEYSISFENGVFCIEGTPSENLWHHRQEIDAKWAVIGNIYESEVQS